MIAVPEDLEPYLSMFPGMARRRVRSLQEARAAALEEGDLLTARCLGTSILVQAIFWLPEVNNNSRRDLADCISRR